MGKEGRPTPLGKAQTVGEYVQRHLEVDDRVHRAWIMGSVRRECPVVSDVDVLVVMNDDSLPLWEVNPEGYGWHMTEKQGFAEIEDVRVEFWRCNKDHVGPMSQFLTGPADLNVYLRSLARNRGLKLSQYGLFGADGERVDYPHPDVAFPTTAEVAFFHALGLEWISPPCRDFWRNQLVARKVDA